jgi:hypothetical protein
MKQIRDWAPTALLIIVLPMLGWYLTFDRNNLKEADASCLAQTKAVCTRVDKLETHYKVTITDMKEDMRDVRDDIKDIKSILVRALGRNVRDSKETYGIDNRRRQ